MLFDISQEAVSKVTYAGGAFWVGKYDAPDLGVMGPGVIILVDGGPMSGFKGGGDPAGGDCAESSLARFTPWSSILTSLQ